MTDIVERLRQPIAVAVEVPQQDGLYENPLPKLMREAADEIESLRAKLERISLLVGAADAGPSFRDIVPPRDSTVLGKFTGETNVE